MVTTTFPDRTSFGRDVARQADGKLVMVGASSSKFAIRRPSCDCALLRSQLSMTTL
jgi:hypothetical protein